MALPTFIPPVAPSPGTGSKPEVKLLRADFGDGYTQPTRDGLNHIRRVLTLNWEVLTGAQAKQISDFLHARGGDQAFYYTPSREADPIKFTCEEWQETHATAGLRSFNATFRQCFTLET